MFWIQPGKPSYSRKGCSIQSQGKLLGKIAEVCSGRSTAPRMPDQASTENDPYGRNCGGMVQLI